jgi:hypothetical protein
MRRRKRADWPIVVYRYHVRPTYETWEQLPGEAKQEIKATHALWNQLVETFERRQARYREIVAQFSQSVEETAKIRSALAQLQQVFLAETRQLTTACLATWSHREFVLTQFLATVNRFFKKQGRAPKPKHGAIRQPSCPRHESFVIHQSDGAARAEFHCFLGGGAQCVVRTLDQHDRSAHLISLE